MCVNKFLFASGTFSEYTSYDYTYRAYKLYDLTYIKMICFLVSNFYVGE